mmetsp:Transcript_23592/g.55140  ORF Transcript_23592/g.55140 Transcript_23592/m.55140 type:complete len:259 (-) Transcript_23592:160-936(-)
MQRHNSCESRWPRMLCSRRWRFRSFCAAKTFLLLPCNKHLVRAGCLWPMPPAASRRRSTECWRWLRKSGALRARPRTMPYARCSPQGPRLPRRRSSSFCKRGGPWAPRLRLLRCRSRSTQPAVVWLPRRQMQHCRQRWLQRLGLVKLQGGGRCSLVTWQSWKPKRRVPPLKLRDAWPSRWRKRWSLGDAPQHCSGPWKARRSVNWPSRCAKPGTWASVIWSDQSGGSWSCSVRSTGNTKWPCRLSTQAWRLQRSGIRT